jgi:hypothetical protein
MDAKKLEAVQSGSVLIQIYIWFFSSLCIGWIQFLGNIYTHTVWCRASALDLFIILNTLYYPIDHKFTTETKVLQLVTT